MVEESFRLNLTTIQHCDRYLQRYILKKLGHPLVLAMDEVDNDISRLIRLSYLLNVLIKIFV
ncbi:MAG: AAA-like domain-containing protein [Brasilonema angustatum HA4187-MV1]|nr:AAA-like domain-containing protein [Brasilonema angustatum HA4187-MV1]